MSATKPDWTEAAEGAAKNFLVEIDGALGWFGRIQVGSAEKKLYMISFRSGFDKGAAHGYAKGREDEAKARTEKGCSVQLCDGGLWECQREEFKERAEKAEAQVQSLREDRESNALDDAEFQRELEKEIDRLRSQLAHRDAELKVAVEALEKINFSRGTSAGEVNAENYAIAQDALARLRGGVG